MLKKIILGTLLVLVVLIAGFAVVVAMQPSDYRVERKVTIAAPPEKVFAQVNDFHKWEAWSPWAKLDPDAKYTYEGPEQGKDAIIKWSGNDNVGEGMMTIMESQPPERIKIKLEFFKPWEGKSDVEFTFKEEGSNTAVTWTMAGKNDSFLAKAICLIMNMDKMIGSDYEKGLANMKSVVEAKEKK